MLSVSYSDFRRAGGLQRHERQERPLGDVIFYFLPDSDTQGPYTAGTATWAPNGDWGKASTSLRPRLVVKAGNAMGTIPKEDVVAMPIKKKKVIFKQMWLDQDRGMDTDQFYVAAKRRFGITTDEAEKIFVEGVVNGWPTK